MECVEYKLASNHWFVGLLPLVRASPSVRQPRRAQRSLQAKCDQAGQGTKRLARQVYGASCGPDVLLWPVVVNYFYWQRACCEL